MAVLEHLSSDEGRGLLLNGKRLTANYAKARAPTGEQLEQYEGGARRKLRLRFRAAAPSESEVKAALGKAEALVCVGEAEAGGEGGEILQVDFASVSAACAAKEVSRGGGGGGAGLRGQTSCAGPEAALGGRDAGPDAPLGPAEHALAPLSPGARGGRGRGRGGRRGGQRRGRRSADRSQQVSPPAPSTRPSSPPAYPPPPSFATSRPRDCLRRLGVVSVEFVVEPVEALPTPPAANGAADAAAGGEGAAEGAGKELVDEIVSGLGEAALGDPPAVAAILTEEAEAASLT